MPDNNDKKIGKGALYVDRGAPTEGAAGFGSFAAQLAAKALERPVPQAIVPTGQADALLRATAAHPPAFTKRATEQVVQQHLDEATSAAFASKAEDERIAQQAMQEAREDNPGVPDNLLAGYANRRQQILQQQRTGREQAVQIELQKQQQADYSNFLKEHSDPHYRNSLLNVGRYKDQIAQTRLIKESPNGSFSLNYGGKFTDADKAILDKRNSRLEDAAPVDMDEAFDRQGNVRPDFLYRLHQMTNGNQQAMRDLFDQFMHGKQSEYNVNEARGYSVSQQQQQAAMNRLHDNNFTKPLYYAARVGQGYQQGASASRALVAGAIDDVTGAKDFSKGYVTELERERKKYPNTPATNESQDWYSLDHVLSTGANMTGEFLPALFGNEAGEGASILEKLGNGYGARLLTNSLHMAKTASPQIFAGYVEDGLHRGYTEDEAIKRALLRTPANILAMSVPGATLNGASMTKVARGILEGAEKEGTLRAAAGAAGRFMAPPVAGGASFAASSLADSYLNHQEEVQQFQERQARGEIPADAKLPRFDYNTALKDAAQQGGLGLIWGTIERVKTASGVIAGPSQAKYIYDAVASPEAFDKAVSQGVSRGTFTPEQGQQLTTFRQQVAPYITEAVTKLNLKPVRAAQYGVEQARMEETAKAVQELSGQISSQRATHSDGTIEEIPLAPNEQGINTPEAGAKAVSRLDELQQQATESARTLQQIKEGSYVRGRTVSGAELLQMTGNFTPQDRLTSDQAGRILSEGPYASSTEDISGFANDQEVKQYLSTLQHPAEAKMYAETHQRLQEERDALAEPHTEKKGSDGTIIRAATKPSEETATEIADLDKQLKDLDKQYPQFAGGMDIADFQAGHANVPTIGADGSIIDGRKRIAQALAAGQTQMEVLRPRSFTEVAREVQDDFEDNIHPHTPDSEGLPEKAKPMLDAATEAYREGLGDEGNAAAAAMSAAHAIHDTGVSRPEAIEMLQRVSGLNVPQAEAFYNQASGTRAEEALPKVESQQQAPESISQNIASAFPRQYEALRESPLWDINRGDLHSDLTQDEVLDYLADGSVPQRYGTEETSSEPAQDQAQPEENPDIAAAKEELRQETDEPTITAFEHRTADDVEKSEPVVAAAESEADNPSATEESDAAAERAIDEAIDVARSESGVDTNNESEESPARSGASTGDTSEQAQAVRGRASILVSSEQLKKLGWSKKGINALAARLRTSFGGDIGLAIIDGREAQRLFGKAYPDAALHDGILYLNIDGLGRTVDGKRSGITPSTLLHESGHLWTEWAKEAAPELHARGMELARQSAAFKYMDALHEGQNPDSPSSMSEAEASRWKSYTETYKGRKDAKDLYAEEVLAHGIQESGKAFTAERDLKSQFGKWLQEFWTSAKAKLGFKGLTAPAFAKLSFDEFTTRVAHEIGSGQALTREIKAALEKPANTGRIAEEANLRAEAQDRLDIASDRPRTSSAPISEEGEASDDAQRSPGAIAATRLASRISASDLVPVIERANPDLMERMAEAVKETSVYAGKTGDDAERADSALLDILDNPRGLSKQDREVMGSLVRRRGSYSMDGLLGEFFGQVESIVNRAEPESGIRAVDVANAFSDNVERMQREEKARQERSERSKELAGDVKYSLPDEADPAQKQTFIDALTEAAADAQREGKPFGDAAYNILVNGRDEGLFTPAEFREMLRDILVGTKHTPEGIQSWIDHVKETIGAGDSARDNGSSPNTHNPVPQDASNPVTPASFETSLMIADRDRELNARGMAEMPEVQRQALKDVWQEAGTELDNDPDAANKLLTVLRRSNTLLGNKRALTEVEVGLLLRKKVSIQEDLHRIDAAVVEAKEQGDDGALTAAILRKTASEAVLEDFNHVVGRAVTTTARGLQALQMIANDRYDMHAMLTARGAARGGEVTEADRAETKKAYEEIQRLQAELAKYKQGNEAKESQQAAKEAVKRQVRKTKKTVRQQASKSPVATEAVQRPGFKAAKSGFAAALERLKGAKFSLPDAPIRRENPVPESEDVRKFIRSAVNDLIEGGMRDVDEIMKTVADQFAEHLPEITARDVADVYSGYGKVSEPDQSDLATARRQIKTLSRLSSAVDDVTKGLAPLRTGYQPGDKAQLVREAETKLRELIAEAGIETNDPTKQMKSALDAAVRATENQIEDLNKEILTGERRPKPQSKVVPDERLMALRAERDRLKIERDKLLGKREMSDEQKIALITASLERAIADKKRRIAAGDIATQQKSAGITSPEIEALRRQSGGLTAQIEELRRQQHPPKSPEELATNAAIKAKQRALDEVNRKIRENDIAFDKKQSKVDAGNSQLQSLNDALAEAKEALGKLRDDAGLTLQQKKDRYAAMIKKRMDALQARIDAGDFEKTSVKPRELDAQEVKLKAELQKVKDEWDAGNRRLRLEQRSKTEKLLDNAANLTRNFKLSGIYVLGKLSSAATVNTALQLPKSAFGAGLAKIFPRLASQAYGEGNSNLLREVRNISKGYIDGWKEFGGIVKSGQSDLDRLYGKHREEPYSFGDSKVAQAANLTNYFGHLHQALKNPLKKAVFKAQFEKRLMNKAEAGVDIGDELIRDQTANEAYQDALRSVFMHDNKLSSAIKDTINKMERPNAQGKVGTGSKFVATILKTLFPFTRVPTNIVNEIGIGITGIPHGAARLIHAYAKGVENLKPEEADYIFRLLKTGSAGAGFLALGWFAPNAFGGFYKQGREDEDGAPKEGEINIGGANLPKWLWHSPTLEAAQFGANARKIYDDKVDDEGETGAMLHGAFESFFSIAGEVPLFQTGGQIYDAVKSGERGKDFWSGLGKGTGRFGTQYLIGNTVPLFVKDVAKLSDKDIPVIGETTKRYSDNSGVLPYLRDEYKKTIPGLRQTLPDEKP